MFQSFTESTDPTQGPPRLAKLRDHMRTQNIDAYLIPRADIHQGEYVAPPDERLAWITGFTGSAGFCAVLQDVAGVFVDGRYRTQVRAQVDLDHFTPVNWPEVKLSEWLKQQLPKGGRIHYNGWLHTAAEIETLRKELDGQNFELHCTDDLIDHLWPDRFQAPIGPLRIYPEHLAGESHADKRARLARELAQAGQTGAVLTLPDSIAWLLNIRGSDIPRNPVPHAFAVLHSDATVTLFIDARKLSDETRAHLGKEVKILPYEAFHKGLQFLEMAPPLRLDKSSVPDRVPELLTQSGKAFDWGQDPCILPKACKNSAEIAATRAAHLRDAAAMCEFLAWYDQQPPGLITEIDVITRLEACRAATGKLLDISFDTIAGAGPHGALPHYRVSEASNRTLQPGDLLVLDSGGQYEDGTTDITRTLPVGEVDEDARAAYTRVLQGMIAMSRIRWPKGLAGRDLDVVARYPLWLADLDYAHGTGHGVGVNLCVHEGPQRLSRVSDVALEPGMIVSNEPGYYREGAFGIRIENLLVVQPAEPLPGGDQLNKLCFETLNFVPINTALIQADMLSEPERDWLNSYHADCRAKIADRLSQQARDWLQKATSPLLR
jgi:Xaa-Pro aminopeptidase